MRLGLAAAFAALALGASGEVHFAATKDWVTNRVAAVVRRVDDATNSVLAAAKGYADGTAWRLTPNYSDWEFHYGRNGYLQPGVDGWEWEWKYGEPEPGKLGVPSQEVLDKCGVFDGEHGSYWINLTNGTYWCGCVRRLKDGAEPDDEGEFDDKLYDYVLLFGRTYEESPLWLWCYAYPYQTFMTNTASYTPPPGLVRDFLVEAVRHIVSYDASNDPWKYQGWGQWTGVRVQPAGDYAARSELSAARREVAVAATNYTDFAVAEHFRTVALPRVTAEAKRYTDASASNAVAAVAGMMELGKRQVVSEIEEYVCASPMALPAAAAAKGTSFNCGSADASGAVCGEDQNGAIEIGRGAKARVTASALISAKSNTAARAVGIAIGEYADATVSDSSARSQQIAIGFHAQAKQSNDIAIGSGAQHTFEDPMSGPAAYANGGEAIAMGYTAKSVARRAVQLGIGTNRTANTLQYLNHTLIDADGQIPMDRLRLAERELGGGLVDQLRRIVSPGNTHATGNGIDYEEPGHPVIEPRLQGVTEITFGTGTNGLFNAGTYIEIAPPLGSRNYELVITNLPQSVWTSNAVEVVDGVAVTNVVPVDIPEPSNFMMDFGSIAETRKVEIRCAPSIGYRRFDSAVTVTNAPLIVKVREPSTNTVWVVVKPWDPMEDL